MAVNIRTCVNTGLAKNRLYYYRVRAVKTGSPTVYSTYSNTAADAEALAGF